MAEKEYQGWKNRATWNVALYINNEEPIYRAAVGFMERRRLWGRGARGAYSAFIRYMHMDEERTADGFRYLGSRLSYRELDEMMGELIA